MEVLEIVERRTRPRIETKIRVQIGGDKDKGEVYRGNLSKSGVFLETTEDLGDVGERIQMRLSLPESQESVKLTGRICRVNGPNKIGKAQGVAVELLRVEARQAKAFDRLIDRLLDARGIGCRKHPRATAQVVAELRTKRMIKKMISTNLCKGGLFLKTSSDEFVLGDTLSVVIVHPSSKRKFVADAEVVHVRKGESEADRDFVEGIGVQFTNLSPIRQSDLSAFLKSILSTHRRN